MKTEGRYSTFICINILKIKIKFRWVCLLKLLVEANVLTSVKNTETNSASFIFIITPKYIVNFAILLKQAQICLLREISAKCLTWSKFCWYLIKSILICAVTDLLSHNTGNCSVNVLISEQYIIASNY